MKLHLTQAEGQNLITSYGDGWVEVNRKRYAHNLIVTPTELLATWEATSFDTLKAEDFLPIANLKPEIFLLGTGQKQKFLHPKFTSMLTEKGIPVEYMDTAAACRTYNILMGEGRKVAAALLL